MRAALIITVLLGGLCAPAPAQTIWSRPYEPNQMAVEVFVPELPNDEASFPSGATFLTATRSFTDNVELAVEVPMARYTSDGTSASAVGNPYVGLGLSSTRLPLLVELGARIPAVPTNAAQTVGQRTDLGRSAAFRDETISLSGLLNGRVALGRHISLRLRTGLTYTSAQTDSTDGAHYWTVPYSAQIWREGNRFVTGFSVVGRPASNTAPNHHDALHRAVLSVMLDGDQLQPGLVLGTGLAPLFTDGRVVLVGGLTLSFSYDR